MSEPSSPPDSATEPLTSRSLATLIVAIVLTWLGTATAIVLFFPTWAERANFGDMFGAVNALFSGLALGGVVLAILLQRQDLKLQRAELALTRAELQRAAKSQEETARLSDLRFIMDLTPRFAQHSHENQQAWDTLREITDRVTSPDDPRWRTVVAALEQYYRSTQFLYQLAMLTTAGVIRTDTLYLLYYDYIADHPDMKLRTLAEWCGTGNELAANYNWQDVLRMARAIHILLKDLAMIHRSHGGEAYDHQLFAIDGLVDELEQRGDPYSDSGARGQ